MVTQSGLADRARGSKMACSQANAHETASAQRIYFLREGLSQHRKEMNENQRKDLLSKAKDWEVTADLQGERQCHKVLQESGERSELVLASTATDSFILVELTVPWEDRMDLSNALKSTWILQWILRQEGMVPICSPSKLL